MGLIYADLELLNSGDLELSRRGIIGADAVKSVKIRALVDSGAYMMAVPEHIAAQLDLPIVEHREFNLADGSSEKLPIVGPLLVRFKNRQTICFAAATRDTEVLLGSIPMEDLDVVLVPQKQTIDVNPESPYMPRMKMKGKFKSLSASSAISA